MNDLAKNSCAAPSLPTALVHTLSLFPELELTEKNGVVYTKSWVVDLLLSLAGYCPEQDLAGRLAVEPAAGDGAFLLSMARRLVASCRLHGHSLNECGSALLAYELEESSANRARASLEMLLCREGVSPVEARSLAEAWVRVGDYLLEADRLPHADFVIGNPPYVRLEDIDPIVGGTYRARYPTMVGRADLYIAFFEAALKQLKPDGVCAFICADRWMLNQYGAELRRFITSSFDVQAVVEMHNANAFDVEVSAYPAVTVIRRGRQGDAVVASANSPLFSVDGSDLACALRAVRTLAVEKLAGIKGVQAARVTTWFSNADPWPCVSPQRLALLKRLEAEFPLLEPEETRTVVGIGVATGCDAVFITKNTSLVEAERLLPLAMAQDAKAGHLLWSGHYLVNPWDEEGLVCLSDCPQLEAYFEAHQERLKNRHIGQRTPERWYRTIDRVNMRLLRKHKLYFPDIKNTIYPVLDRGETYPHHNLYFVQSDRWDMEVLGGLLLSRVAQFFVECYGVRMRGGYLRFQAQYLRRIRVPRLETISEHQANELREAFRLFDVTRATRVALDLYGIDTVTGRPTVKAASE